MSLTIIQKPLYKVLPASNNIMYTVEDTTSVATKFKVKYVADIHVISNRANTLTASNLINTVKVSPNSVGVGILDISSILSSQVDTQRTGSTSGAGSTFKLSSNAHSIHTIDKLARDESGVTWYVVKFRVEYSDTASGVVIDSGQSVLDSARLIYNGFLKGNDILSQSGLDYGYDLDSRGLINNDDLSGFLSNMPTTLYARLEDFGTVSFFDDMDITNYGVSQGTNGANNKVANIRFILFSNTIGLGVINRAITYTGGFQTTQSDNKDVKRCFSGFYPANLKEHNTWNINEADIVYYTVQLFDSLGLAISKLYTVNIIGDDCKGFEGIRLGWLNQYGVFDYYTFNKKSVRTISTERQNYTQHSGSWNGSSFDMNGSVGGQRSYNTSSKEQILMNTDYIPEEEALILEELLISPEVYLINKHEQLDAYGFVNKYVEPVILIDNSITRKTRANDRLINHSFTIEKSRMTKTQNI